MFAKIRFYWGASVISFNTAVFMIPILMIFKKHKSTIIHYINRMTLFMIGGKCVQEGKIDTDTDIFVMNHQGIIDIIALEALQNNHLRWVAKKELFDTLWFGNLLKYGEMISVNRTNKAGLLKLIKDIKISKETMHRPVAIFPEGTRASDQELLSFKQGTKIAANKLGLKIQPIIITGSKWVLNEHNKTAHNGTVHCRFLPTIDVSTADEDWFEILKVQMQEAVNHEYTHHNRCR